MQGVRSAGRRDRFVADILRRLALALPLLWLAAPAHSAGDDEPGEWELALNLGEFGVFDRLELFEVGVELRFPTWRYGIRPTTGATFLENGGFYGYAGLRVELDLGERFYFAPSTAVGLYKEGSFDLGGPLEFRNALELGWRPTAGTSVGFGISHLSNGGIYDRNVGLETLYVSIGVSL